MVGHQQPMPCPRRPDPLGVLLRMCAPEQEDLGRLVKRDRVDHRIGEPSPAGFGVAGRSIPFDRQAGVEQQHPGIDPGTQVATARQFSAEVIDQLLPDVAQAGRDLHAVGHRERQPLGLAGTVVGILTQDDDFDLRRRQAAVQEVRA